MLKGMEAKLDALVRVSAAQQQELVAAYAAEVCRLSLLQFYDQNLHICHPGF